MDEPSDQMRPLLRTVSTRPAVLTQPGPTITFERLFVRVWLAEQQQQQQQWWK